MEMIRINTAGSVDDGKSTLIGRLLHDVGALTREQEELVAKKTQEKGMADLDFSVITDGLVAEREQGITIDVAHIYFKSDSRKFIIADSPGHVEYTRNMVTGASTSNASVILIDARKGLLEQSFRHFFISRLLDIEHIVFCINKMDLVGYEEDVFLNIAAEIAKMIEKAPFEKPIYHVIPVSSLKGENLVRASSKMPWYDGKTLLEILHQIPVRRNAELPFRMDVQQVLHVQNADFVDFRAFTGRLISGLVKVGDVISVLPAGREAAVKEIRRFKEQLQEAVEGDSVMLVLEKEIDGSRGSMITQWGDDISTRKELNATLVWLDATHSRPGGRYLVQAGTRLAQAKLNAIHAIIKPENPPQHESADELKMNDIGVVELRLSQPLYLDAFRSNKGNGAFILIDPQTNYTCAVGFVS